MQKIKSSFFSAASLLTQLSAKLVAELQQTAVGEVNWQVMEQRLVFVKDKEELAPAMRMKQTSALL